MEVLKSRHESMTRVGSCKPLQRGRGPSDLHPLGRLHTHWPKDDPVANAADPRRPTEPAATGYLWGLRQCLCASPPFMRCQEFSRKDYQKLANAMERHEQLREVHGTQIDGM